MDIETHAKEAVGRAKGAIAMVEVPEPDAVVGRRRAQHRKTAIASALALVVLGAGAVAAVATTHGTNSKQKIQVQQPSNDLPDAVLAGLKAHFADDGTSHLTSADWVLTTRAGAREAGLAAEGNGSDTLYVFDVRGRWELVVPCPAPLPGSPQQSCPGSVVYERYVSVTPAGLFDADIATPETRPDLGPLGTVGHVRLGPERVEFREVMGEVPYAGTGQGTCENGKQVTPRAHRIDGAEEVVADLHNTSCYLLGPTIMDNTNVDQATASQQPSDNQWVVNLQWSNDDFVNKVASPYVNKQVAMVVGDNVVSAPMINQGITGRDITISANFTQAEAEQLAHDLAPVPASAGPTTTTIAS